MAEPYKLYVNEDRTILVRFWNSGTVEVATRDKHPLQDSVVWRPPQILTEEKT